MASMSLAESGDTKATAPLRALRGVFEPGAERDTWQNDNGKF